MATDIRNLQHPMQDIVRQWDVKIRDALEIKWKKFGQFAHEANMFFDGNHNWMWEPQNAQGPKGFLDQDDQNVAPTFRMTVNKVFEAVALFGPVLYHRNPNVMVSSKKTLDIPPPALGLDMNQPQHAEYYQQLVGQEQMSGVVRDACADVKGAYLNWLQYESNKKDHARLAITEAIVKGMGLLWTEMHQEPGSKIRYPKSSFGSCEDLVVDPDAVYWEDVKWIARKCVHPVYEVEREYGYEPGQLKGIYQSKWNQAELASDRGKRGKKERTGKSFDLIEYWQVWSKGGFGDRLKPATGKHLSASNKHYDWGMLGDFCYLVIAKDIPFPLNIPSWSLQEGEERIRARAQWPIPFWTDGGWPCRRLTFYDKPREVWPISLIKPAIGELRFVNWCMSFLASRVAASCTSYIGMLKRAAEEIRGQLSDTNLGPFKIVELPEIMGKSLNEIFSVFNAPDISNSVWTMVAQVMDMIDKRTGLTELMYGLSGRQIRSATEADVKDQNVSVRPDEMANRVEDWLSETARSEMQAARWFLGAEDVQQVLGGPAAMVWQQHVMTTDIDRVVRDFDYRIEAGSARKPNKNNRIRQLNELGQVAANVMQMSLNQGNPGPWNAWITEWCKANDLEYQPFLIPPPPPPDPNQPDPAQIQLQMEQMKAQFEMQMEQMKAQMDQQSHQQEMTQDQEEHEQDMKQSSEKHRMELSFLRGRKAAASNGNGTTKSGVN